ncbi:MAG: ABC transporter ATP-binding protein [Eubacteriales bacterium]|nr:ABC transporter ATP-binding protein [Eubacteriales bacterium]
MPVLTIKDLTKDYGSKFGGNVCHALKGVDMDVEKGEFVGVMGASGSGKTTLLNCISTIDTPTSGTVVIDGQELKDLKAERLTVFRRDKLGFVFQDFNLLDTMTLGENMILPLSLKGTAAKAIEQAAGPIADMLGISELMGKYPYEVSMGQRQRGAIARAVIGEPALLLADEPTGALDSKSGRDVLTCFQTLNTVNRTTILMVTHDAFTASFCSRVIFLKDGKLFNELRSNGDRKTMYDKIINVLSVLGGDGNDSR